LWQVNLLWRRHIIDYVLLHTIRPWTVDSDPDTDPRRRLRIRQQSNVPADADITPAGELRRSVVIRQASHLMFPLLPMRGDAMIPFLAKAEPGLFGQ
jgi:hypothetical protein